LANENIYALLDGGVVTDLLVGDDGSLKLPYKAKDILVGLPYEFELETLNYESLDSLGIKKIINNIEVKILNSREDFFIKNDDDTLMQNSRSYESVVDSNKLFNRSVEFCNLALPSKEVSVKIIQKFPLPINILAISANISLQEIETQ